MCRIRLTTVILLVAWTGVIRAQETDPTLPYKNALTKAGKEISELRSDIDKLTATSLVTKSYQAALVADYEHTIAMRAHLSRLFWWQLISAYSLLFVTILVAVFGVYVSVKELGKAMRASTAVTRQPGSIATEGATDSGNDHANQLAVGSHQLKISPTEINITTALTGLVILVLALGYLFLFVNQVMDFQPPVSTSENTSSEKK